LFSNTLSLCSSLSVRDHVTIVDWEGKLNSDVASSVIRSISAH
jgi:hypothetical protein